MAKTSIGLKLDNNGDRRKIVLVLSFKAIKFNMYG